MTPFLDVRFQIPKCCVYNLCNKISAACFVCAWNPLRHSPVYLLWSTVLIRYPWMAWHGGMFGKDPFRLRQGRVEWLHFYLVLWERQDGKEGKQSKKHRQRHWEWFIIDWKVIGRCRFCFHWAMRCESLESLCLFYSFFASSSSILQAYFQDSFDRIYLRFTI